MCLPDGSFEKILLSKVINIPCIYRTQHSSVCGSSVIIIDVSSSISVEQKKKIPLFIFFFSFILFFIISQKYARHSYRSFPFEALTLKINLIISADKIPFKFLVTGAKITTFTDRQRERGQQGNGYI